MIDLLITGAAIYGVFCLGRTAWRCSKAKSQTRQWEQAEATQRQRQWEIQQQARRRAAAKIQEAARLMQVALMQLRQSPDFRRAATFAKHAKNIPAAFRIRQFQRFRPLMVQHITARLQQGMSAEELLPGLTELVTALGVADYEADYIRREAEGQTQPTATPRPAYAARVRQLQVEHEQRLDTLRSLPNIDAELREQLVESEEQRFRDCMLALGQADGEQQNP